MADQLSELDQLHALGDTKFGRPRGGARARDRRAGAAPAADALGRWRGPHPTFKQAAIRPSSKRSGQRLTREQVVTLPGVLADVACAYSSLRSASVGFR